MKKVIGYILLGLLGLGFLYGIYLIQDSILLALTSLALSLGILGLVFLAVWLITD